MPQSTPDRAYAEHLAGGRAAFARYDWAAARREFDAAVAREATGEALECLADAAWWLDDEGATFSAREAAYRAYRSGGDRHSAARMAIWLANDSLDFRGAPAVASGWIRRAHRLLDGLDDTPEYAALVAWEAHMALMLRNDAAETLQLTAAAIEAARSLGLTDVEMLALVIEGLALVTAGRVQEGVARVDEAATAVMAGDIDDLVIAGTILCYTMDACGRVRDYDRAQQWCDRVKRWAEEQRFPVIFAACRPHYAAVLVWRGAWAEAETELLAARRGLEQSRPPMAVESIVRLAELRWRQGRWDEAKALFDQVEHEGLAQLGRAELALDEGDTGPRATSRSASFAGSPRTIALSGRWASTWRHESSWRAAASPKPARWRMNCSRSPAMSVPARSLPRRRARARSSLLLAATTKRRAQASRTPSTCISSVARSSRRRGRG